ncbi:hypothetical protein GCM10009659_24720 [Leucobacter albus]
MLERIHADIRLAKQRAQALGELAETQATVQGKAMSELHDVVVTVDAAGQMIDLQIAAKALQRGGLRLSAEIVTLVAKAKLDAQAQTHRAALKVLGADDPILWGYSATLLDADSPAIDPTRRRMGYVPLTDTPAGEATWNGSR